MSDKTIKHFIFVRFFPKQNQDYLYNILAPNFLKTQLPLAKNMLKSLENQTNKNFELVFLVNKKHISDKKYDFIFSTLKEFTTLPIKFIADGDNKMPLLLNAAYENYDYVIQTRMDFDDFVFKDAVADTQSKVVDCEDVLSYGYCKGYMYFDGKLYFYPYPSRGLGHHSIFQSLIMKSSFAKNLPLLGVYFGGHNVIKRKLKEFLAKNDVKFSESMFQQNTATVAYIYFRHEFSNEVVARNRDVLSKIERENLIVVEDVDKKQLEDEFGFFHELNSIK